MISRHFFHHISFGQILRYFRIFWVWAQFWAQIWTRNHQKWVHTTQLSLGNTPGAGFEILWFLGGNIISTIQSSSVNDMHVWSVICTLWKLWCLSEKIHSILLRCNVFNILWILRTIYVLSWFYSSVGSNLKIPNLEPSEPPKTEPRTYRTSSFLLKTEPRTYQTS